MRRTHLLSLTFTMLILACAPAKPEGGGVDATSPGPQDAGGNGTDPELIPDPGYAKMEASPQRMGNATTGYQALITKDYVSCGFPLQAVAIQFGPTAEEDKIPGRTGDNANLPYFLTAITRPNGAKLAVLNCLSCHAEKLDGKLIIGLGGVNRDFTGTKEDADRAMSLAKFVSGPDGIEFRKWAERMVQVGQYATTSTVGVNPADNLTSALFAHRNPKTLAWSNTPLIEMPPVDPAPADVPPWWRMKKKNVLYANGAGKGDHARLIMTAATLCTDSVTEAQQIDSYFPDILAYLSSIEAPRYPQPLDGALRAKGEEVFKQNCSVCHGTYGENSTYPSYLIPREVIGTDPVMATKTGHLDARFQDWFKNSFFGELASLAPEEGYVAPPLDGVWATAPFLHNGSVPTLAALLDSKKRPTYWSRELSSRNYDHAAVGWKFTTLTSGKAAETDPAKKKLIYDTTLPGYGNQGHTFGDALAEEDRTALIEYLKGI